MSWLSNGKEVRPKVRVPDFPSEATGFAVFRGRDLLDVCLRGIPITDLGPFDSLAFYGVKGGVRVRPHWWYKGNLYRIEGFAKDSETLEEMVVYRALYGEHGLWVRPAKMFFETIERDGKRMKRFELVGDH